MVRLLVGQRGGGFHVPPPMPMVAYARAEMAQDASSKIDPGEQKLQVSVSMSFELQ